MTRLAAVIGSPVRHSLSPVMHNAAFAAGGLDWSFTRFEIIAGGVPAALAAMAPLDIGGYAVTMPHKQAAARAVDELDPAAAALDSINTVVLRDDGSTLGASTDGAGFVSWLAACGVAVSGMSVVVLGAGAAARSIVDALARAGAADVAIVNRTAAAATHAAGLAQVARVGSLADLETAAIVVNATSVGMGAEACPIDPALLHPGHVVADIVYHPLETSLLRAAAEVGATAIDGLGMLVHQAVLQQELWTGVRPDPAVLRHAAERELAARSTRPAG
jgi:shikimate dehydrogenase